MNGSKACDILLKQRVPENVLLFVQTVLDSWWFTDGDYMLGEFPVVIYLINFLVLIYRELGGFCSQT